MNKRESGYYWVKYTSPRVGIYSPTWTIGLYVKDGDRWGLPFASHNFDENDFSEISPHRLMPPPMYETGMLA